MDTTDPNPNPGTEHVVLCIDADCPSCLWPERTFSTDTARFGCPKCAYTSVERDA